MLYDKKFRFFVYLLVLLVLTLPLQSSSFGLVISPLQIQSKDYRNLVDQLFKLKSRSNEIMQMIKELDWRKKDIDIEVSSFKSQIAQTQFDLSKSLATLNDRAKDIYKDKSLPVKADAKLIKKIKEDKELLVGLRDELIRNIEKADRLKEEKENSLREINTLKAELNNQIRLADQKQLAELNKRVLRMQNNITSSTASNVIALAQQYLGTPYVWGGTDITGFDCSGFSQFIYRQLGIYLPRVADDQMKYLYSKGRAILPNNLMPGDLVFYGRGGYAGHVVFYLGNGYIIGANGGQYTGGSVSIKKLDYRSDYLGAARP